MLKEIHPVRAAIAIIAVGATVGFIQQGVALSEAWWAILASVATFYFMQKD